MFVESVALELSAQMDLVPDLQVNAALQTKTFVETEDVERVARRAQTVLAPLPLTDVPLLVIVVLVSLLVDPTVNA